MRTALAAVLALSLACGGGGPTPAPPSSTSDPAPGPGATPTPPPVQPPSSAPGAPTVALERLDPSAECDGLVPDRAPEPVAISRSAPAGFTCGGALSDGTGSVAASARSGSEASWQVFDRAGAAGRTFSAWPLLAQPAGWLGGVSTAAADGGAVVQVIALGADGRVARTETVSSDPEQVITRGWSLSGDPLGGALAVVAHTDRLHNHWSALRAQRLDAAGAPRWSGQAAFGARSEADVLFLAGGVSRQGEALAIWQHSAWVDAARLGGDGAVTAGQDLAEPAAELTGSDALRHALELVPLLDGGLALRADGAFRRVYPPLATTSAPLPDWLAARAGWTLRFTRGNAGYALLPPPGQDAPECAQAIELLAPSGRLCGRVWLRQPGGGRCATGAVEQGWDGTVAQQDAQGACAWRFWPGLLAR